MTSKEKNEVYRRVLNILLARDSSTYNYPHLCYMANSIAIDLWYLENQGYCPDMSFDEYYSTFWEILSFKPTRLKLENSDEENWWPVEDIDIRIEVIEKCIEMTK